MRQWSCSLAALLCCSLLCMQQVRGDEAPTKAAVPSQLNSTVAPATPATTIKPKINIAESSVCKKCICDIKANKLNCSGTGMDHWFSAEEWETLQNGDFTFETILLTHNNLTTVPQLPTYPVVNLYLDFNRIDSIEKGAFKSLTELQVLDLSHNRLSSKALKPDSFQGVYSTNSYEPLGKLRELNLGYNELHNLDSDLFEHVPNLEILILCKNVFQVIDHNSEIAITGLTSLKTLDLSYMELSDLPDHLLHGPRDLETLILSGNLLDELPDNIELGINLKRLVLDENLMVNFTGDSAFPKLINLEYLSISYMPELTSINKEDLSNLQNLTTLIASNNPKLSVIDANAFARATANPEIFEYPPLQKLYLHNNNLTVLERELVQRWDKIRTIDLRFNPWACDCSNSWLVHTLMAQIKSTTPMLANSVRCGTPAAWADKQLIVLNENHPPSLVCVRDSNPSRDGLILVSLLVGILAGIPLTIATVMIYRKGCFGILNRVQRGGDGALYNRASFTDDFHI